MNHVDRLLSRLEGVVQRGRNWKALCPAHDDLAPSLHVSLGSDGAILLTCHAGCKTEDVLRGLDLEWSNLYPGEGEREDGKVELVAVDQVAEVDLRDRVYADLLYGLTLSDSHRDQLLRRGLTAEQIETNRYRSLSFLSASQVATRLHEKYGEELFKVPGFRAKAAGAVLTQSSGLLVPVRDASRRIQACQVRKEEGPSKYVWLSGDVSPGTPVHITGVSALKRPESIRVTEGPLKADVVYALEPRFPVIGVPGVSTFKECVPLLRQLRPETVRVAFDADWRKKEPVAKSLKGLVAVLLEERFKVLIESWDIADGKGLDDYLAGPRGSMTVTPVTDVNEWWTGVLKSLPRERRLTTINASTVKRQKIEWLWRDWLPKGAVVLFDGDPGYGKSNIIADLATRITRGWNFPGEESGPSAGKVIYLSAEDDWSRTHIPRLEEAGADLTQVELVPAYDGDGNRVIELPKNLDLLRDAALEHRPVIVVFDPISSYVGDKYDLTGSEQDVRKILNPLAVIAEQLQTTVIVIRHTNKSRGPAMHRSSGVLGGFVAVARSCIRAERDPDDLDSYLLVSVKTNWGKTPKSRKYRVLSHEHDDSVSRVEWAGLSDYTADDLAKIAFESRKDDTRTLRATAWLESVLRHGAMSRKELERRAGVAGIAWKRVEAAKSELNIFISDGLWRLNDGEGIARQGVSCGAEDGSASLGNWNRLCEGSAVGSG